MSAAGDVQICIVNYNTWPEVALCVESIMQHTHRCEYQITIVDNNSDGDPPKEFFDRLSRAEVVRLPRNVGFVRASNIAIRRRPTTRYVLLLNGDTVVRSDVISAFVQFLDNHADAGAVSCVQLDSNLRPHMTSYALPSVWVLLAHLLRLKRFMPPDPIRSRLASILGWLGARNAASYFDSARTKDAPREAIVLSGACLCFRRAVIAEVGWPDEQFFLGPDDWDFCLRLRSAGWKNFVLEGQSIIHTVGAARARRGGFAARRYYAGWFYFYRKHHGLRGDLFLKTVVAAVLIGKLAHAAAGAKWGRRERRVNARRESMLWRRLFRNAMSNADD